LAAAEKPTKQKIDDGECDGERRAADYNAAAMKMSREKPFPAAPFPVRQNHHIKN